MLIFLEVFQTLGHLCLPHRSIALPLVTVGNVVSVSGWSQGQESVQTPQ